MSSNSNCSYMELSSSTYFPFISGNSCILWRRKKSHQTCEKIWAEMIFGWPPFKIICDIPIFLAASSFCNYDPNKILYMQYTNIYSYYFYCFQYIMGQLMQFPVNVFKQIWIIFLWFSRFKGAKRDQHQKWWVFYSPLYM